MKGFLFVLIITFVINRGVYCDSQEEKIIVEKINYGPEKTFLQADVRKTIICKGSNRNQKIEWMDPVGKVVTKQSAKRVFTQEHFINSVKDRIPVTVLVFTRALVEDTGVWTCRTGDRHQNVSLCVIEQAEFINVLEEVNVDRGRSITLSCQASGEPEPALLWYRNGEIITEEMNPVKYKVLTKYGKEGYEGLLTILSLESEDSGIYTCDAQQENKAVEDCSINSMINITLHVNYAPKFKSDSTTVAAKENESVELACVADGYPPPQYRWFTKGADEARSEHTTDNIQALDAGGKSGLSVKVNESTFNLRYICQASNKYGEAENVFRILKMQSPDKPDEIAVVNATEDSLLLKITWAGRLLFPINAMEIQYIDTGNIEEPGQNISESVWDSSKAVVFEDVVINTMQPIYTVAEVKLTKLAAAMEYILRVRASNDEGYSPWSDAVICLTSTQEDVTVQEESTEKNEVTQIDGTFYGIIFAIGLCVVAIAYMFAMRYA